MADFSISAVAKLPPDLQAAIKTQIPDDAKQALASVISTGLPIQPDQILSILSSSNPIQATIDTVKNIPIPIPGVPFPISINQVEQAAKPFIEIGEKAVDWIKGGPVKRKRFRSRLKLGAQFFNWTMDKDPLLILRDGQIPSAAFVDRFKNDLVLIGTTSKHPWKEPFDILWHTKFYHNDTMGKSGSYADLFLKPKSIVQMYVDRMKDLAKQRMQADALAFKLATEKKRALDMINARKRASEKWESAQTRKRNVETDALNFLKFAMIGNPSLAIDPTAYRGMDNRFAAICANLMAQIPGKYDPEYAKSWFTFTIPNKLRPLALADPNVQAALDIGAGGL